MAFSNAETTPLKAFKSPSAWQVRQLAIVFTASIFLSATLLFSVQPMFSKLVLPLLGGSSNVWNTAMVFFQSMLLGGYIYAHAISKMLRLKWQVAIHLALLLLGLVFLPLSIAQGWTVPTSGTPIFWLLGLFAVSIGVPFFAISANAPLFQSWFARTHHPDASDPYFLYAASNAGSLLVLCAYPILIEPNLRLDLQTGSWTVGFISLIVCIGFCGVLALRSAPTEVIDKPMETKQVEKYKIQLKTVAYWILLAFIPSSLMLGVTSYITNNIASAPFLWILPLALYLLTFVIVFAKRPVITYKQLGWVFPWVILAGFAIISIGHIPHWVSIAGSLVIYFLITLYCHSRLVEARPPVEGLTQFYIFMSLGGVLGGVFNALIAPILFNDIYEYTLVLWLSGLVIAADVVLIKKPSRQSLTQAVILLSLAFISVVIAQTFLEESSLVSILLFLALGIMAMRELKFKASLIAFNSLAALAFILPLLGTNLVYKDRSFFSMIKVDTQTDGDVVAHAFVHGDTVHNYQLRGEGLETIPLAYYAEGNTFSQVVKAVQSVKEAPSIAVIGLGAGALSCYERAGESWTYFEIDPAVVDMAKDPNLFSYMNKCATNPDIRIGDARMTIKALPKTSQDLIIVDAFSSDSIPVHLLTRESLATYRKHLTEDGLIFFHTSNRVMDVSSVVKRLAEDIGWDARLIHRPNMDTHPYKAFVTPSTAVLIGKPEQIDALKKDHADWQDFEASPYVKLWTDDYSSIIGPMRAKMQQYKIETHSD